nr:hypothetical protein [Escherichia coli]
MFIDIIALRFNLKEGGQNYDVMGWNQNSRLMTYWDHTKTPHFLHRSLIATCHPGGGNCHPRPQYEGMVNDFTLEMDAESCDI